jgi:hypothetical protein
LSSTALAAEVPAASLKRQYERGSAFITAVGKSEPLPYEYVVQAVDDVGGHTLASRSARYWYCHVATEFASFGSERSVKTVATCGAVAPLGVDQVRCSARPDTEVIVVSRLALS